MMLLKNAYIDRLRLEKPHLKNLEVNNLHF